MPKISIIMSIYNERSDFLKKSIESMLNQSFADFEFIIVNDGSGDENFDLLNNYAKNDARIILINNNLNIGLTKSLNVAIKKSQGKFIARMDSDDISSPNRLENQMKFLLENKFDLLASNCDIIDENGKVIKEKRLSVLVKLKRSLFKGNFFTHSTFFGTRKIFEELYNEEFAKAQDYEFLLRTLGKGYNIGYMPDCLLAYRITGGNISTKSAKQQEWSAIKARWLALSKYGYSPFYLPYLIRALISFAIPYKIKRFAIYNVIK